MPQDLRFIDSAFACEVVLTGPAKALYEAARPQFERLKGIKSLGLTAHTNDVAMQTRHQHVVGLMRIFNKLCQQTKDKGLPKEFLWSFWCRLCFSQTGHAALSYDSEKAILLACHLDTNFRAALRTLVEPVIAKLAACPKCTKPCEVRTKGSADANSWFDLLVDRNRWQSLYLWIAALKLLREPRVLAILNTQVVDVRNRLGFSEPEALKLMVAPGCKWESPVRNLSRLDFIVRDLAFSGTLGIQLDVDTLVSEANAPHSDWKLLNSLSAYLSDALYESIPAQLTSALFQRALASLLIAGKVTVEELFGVDPQNALNDDRIIETVARTRFGREIFDRETRSSWRAWPITTHVDPDGIPCEMEKGITGQAKGHLTAHSGLKVTCLKLRKKNTLAIAMCHQSLAARPRAKAFVKLCRSLLLKQYPQLTSENLTDALYEALVDRQCEHGIKAAAERLSKLTVPPKLLQGSAQAVHSRALAGFESSEELGFRIGDFEYSFSGDRHELLINTMHAAISGNDALRLTLGLPMERASEILWSQLLKWQTIYFGQRPTKRVMFLVTGVQEILGRQVIAGATHAETDLELYALLEALKHPGQSVSFRIALPNLKLIKEDGLIENEYDVVSVVLKEDNYVEVWVWGVTVEENLTPKRTADMAKIQKLKDLLGQRWQTDVTVRTCYVHKDGNDICCEIDGRQERRTIS